MNNFYLLIVVCLFVGAESRYAKVEANLALTVIEEAPRQFNAELVRICAQQTELSLQEWLMFHANDFRNVTEATQCFTHCLYEQMGLMHDGVFVEQDLIDHLSELSNPTWLSQHACHSLRSANKCETAHKIHECKQKILSEKLNVEQGQIEETTTQFTTTTRYES